MTLFIPIFIGLVILSTLGVGILRALSKRRPILLDQPNERSLHTQPKPRGGGVVIAILVIIALALHVSTDGIRNMNEPMILLSLALIAGIGFIDDLFSIPALPRLVVHMLAALIFCLALPWLVPGNLLSLGITEVVIGGTLFLSVLWVAWSANVFNFMDGADGLAGLQATIGGIGVAGVGFMLNDPLVLWIGGCVGATSLGFLFHNWSPAKIFLGDVGSAFIGFVFGLVPVLLMNPDEARPYGFAPIVAVSIAWPFYFDSGRTLLQRIWRKERFWTPHREHSYQKAILSGTSHASVAFAYAVLSLIPISFLLAGLYFMPVFHVLASFGLALSTFGMFVFYKYSLKRDEE